MSVAKTPEIPVLSTCKRNIIRTEVKTKFIAACMNYSVCILRIEREDEVGKPKPRQRLSPLMLSLMGTFVTP